MDGGDVSMVAVAVATPLRQHSRSVGDRVKVRGGSHVPSSLVWVSVPPSGSASSSAPGSLKGLSLWEKTQEGGGREPSACCPFIMGTKGWVGGGCTDGVNIANHSPRSCDYQNIQLPLISCSLALTLFNIHKISFRHITDVIKTIKRSTAGAKPTE